MEASRRLGRLHYLIRIHLEIFNEVGGASRNRMSKMAYYQNMLTNIP